jgi:hypothetical protein
MVAMVVVSFTALDTVIFSKLVGVTGEVELGAEAAFRVMCWLPLVVGLRNYFHGIALAELETRAMAYGALLRVLAIALVGWTSLERGGLGHVGAAAILVLGFAVEATVVFVAEMRGSRSRSSRMPDDETPTHDATTDITPPEG